MIYFNWQGSSPDFKFENAVRELHNNLLPDSPTQIGTQDAKAQLYTYLHDTSKDEMIKRGYDVYTSVETIIGGTFRRGNLQIRLNASDDGVSNGYAIIYGDLWQEGGLIYCEGKNPVHTLEGGT